MFGNRKKQRLFVIAVVLVLGHSNVRAQRFSLGARAEVSAPTGWFNRVARPGVGGSLNFQYVFGDVFGGTVSMVGAYGYAAWKGVGQQGAFGKAIDRNATMIDVGAKIYLANTSSRRLLPYLTALAGFWRTKESDRFENIVNSFRPSFSLGLGLEVRLNQRISLDVSGGFRSAIVIVQDEAEEPTWRMFVFGLGLLIKP